MEILLGKEHTNILAALGPDLQKAKYGKVCLYKWLGLDVLPNVLT